jgi:hypothetical protein
LAVHFGIIKNNKVMANLIGTYQKDKSNLYKGDIQLVIGTRQKPTLRKPSNFLLFRHPTGKHTYISSLYPIACNEPKNDSQAYSFDLDNIGYILTIEQGGKATIQTNLNSTNAINNVELGTKIVPKW